MIRDLPDRAGTALEVARIHLGLGERDSALVWLDHAVDRHDVKLNAETLWSPVWAPLHRDPRFRGFLRRLNLPDRR